MIFLGDYFYPFKDNREIFKLNQGFLNEKKFLNLEAAILDSDKYLKATKGSALLSSLYAYDTMARLNVKGVGLANNHIFDFYHDIEKQKSELRQRGIEVCGAGINLNEALKPALIEDEKYKYVVLSFGWDVIGCRYAEFDREGIAPLRSTHVIDAISKVSRKWPDRKVILYLHWNYEFEYYPQPADRRLAFSAIDAGADAVIGHHPHIVGVYEEYRKKPIFYSLGNFFMPMSMNFGNRAQTGLGIKYDEKLENIKLYWLFNNENKLEVELKELLVESKKVEDITYLFQDDLYLYKKWFGKNRRKKKLLPIYNNHDKSLRNSVFYKLLNIRNRLVYNLTVSGLRKRNN